MKFHIISLVLALSWSLLWGTAVMAANSVVSAQQEEWIYQELGLLYEEGHLPGYPQQWVESGQELSRFEIAYYIKQILAVKFGDDAYNAFSKEATAGFQKLVVEFSEELTALGIKITEISKISPSLANVAKKIESYQDLEELLKTRNPNIESVAPKPYFYLGQYFQSLQRKTFVFMPLDFINADDLRLLNGTATNINVLNSTKLGEDRSFLVLRGTLPIENEVILEGYYLFPLENELESEVKLWNNDGRLLTLLDEINRIRKIEYLRRFEAPFSLAGFARSEIKLQSDVLLGNINQGMKVGGLLLFSQNYSVNNIYGINEFGLPFYGTSQGTLPTGIDLEKFDINSPESVSINIYSSKALSPYTSIAGGVDLLYRQPESSTLLDNYSLSDTKASAGLTYQMNNYWTFLAYQSFVNFRLKTGVLSTTSVALDYGGWATFWLAYQLLDFNEPVVTGTLRFRF